MQDTIEGMARVHTQSTRTAYKGKYIMWRNIALMAITSWLFTVGFLARSAQTTMRLNQELASMEKTTVVVR